MCKFNLQNINITIGHSIFSIGGLFTLMLVHRNKLALFNHSISFLFNILSYGVEKKDTYKI